MESIDRLRDYALTAPAASMGSMARAIVAGMADEIERDVAELTDERDLLKTQWEAGVDFDQRLEACAESREDVTLFGVDYTPLPVDADGEPIHVGDWITGEWDAKAKVEAVTSDDVYWWEPDGCHWCHAHEVRHHHAPTVEDVLREFAYGLGVPVADSYVAATAAKLRLAGEDE